MGILFSAFCSRFAAFIRTDETCPDAARRPSPIPYRVDRIGSFLLPYERFRLPFAERFLKGESRKRVRFIFGGELPPGFTLAQIADCIAAAQAANAASVLAMRPEYRNARFAEFDPVDEFTPAWVIRDYRVFISLP